jgi:filamentous hemagglutinin family protein
MKISLISGATQSHRFLCSIIASLSLLAPLGVRATLPNTGTGNLSVVVGSATYPTLANGTTGTLTITASTPTTVLGWGNFSDGSGAGGSLAVGDIINFALPGSSAALLNQVSGGAASTINGTITSTGKVFILNPAGVTIGATGVINAAGFYASTVPETIAYFLATNSLQAFTATPPATSTTGVVVVNSGATLATVGGTGTIGFAGSTVTVNGLATPITGNLYIETQAPAAAGTTVTLGASATATTIGAVGAGGNLTIVSTGGNVNLAQAANVTITGAATINTAGSVAGGSVVTDSTGMVFSAATVGAASTLNTGTGAVTFANAGGSGAADFANLGLTAGTTALVDPTANTVSLAASTVTGSLAVTSVGGSIATTGALGATGNISLTANTAGKSITVTTTGNASFGPISSSGAGDSVTLTGSGNLSLTAAVTSPTVTITTTGGNYIAAAGITAATKETISATGNVSINADSSPLLSVTSGGTLSETAAVTSAAATFNAPTISLAGFANALTAVELLGGSGTGATPVQLTNAAATLTLLNGTNVTGAATIANAGGIAVGTASSDTIAFGSTLTLNATAAGAITTTANNFNVTGALSSSSTNSAITLGATGATNAGFGQISGASGTGLYTINSSKPVNLGTLSTTGGLAVVAGGAITNTGNLVVTASGGVALTAGTTGAPASIQLGATGSANNDVIAGTITVNNATSLKLFDKPGAGVTVATGTNALPAATIAITDGNNLTVDANTSTKALASLSAALTGGNGNLTVSDAGSLTLSNTTNVGTGNTTVTVNGNGSTFTFGSGVALAGTGAATFTTTGTSTLITDTAASPISIAGTTAFNGGVISVNSNLTDAFGPLNVNSSASVAVTTGTTLNLGAITLTGTSGTLLLSSATGNITQGASAITIPTGYTGATFSAPAGNVTLNLAGGNAINATVPIALTAGPAGSATVINNGAVLLGNGAVPGGTFTVSTLTSGGSITQAVGTSLFEFGTATLTTQGGAINLSNAGNNFGGLAIDSTNVGGSAAGAAVSIRESGTNHYIVVNTGTGGAFTAVDDLANIIQDSGAGTGLLIGGTTSLSAPKGSITLNNTLNNFNGAGIEAITAPGTGAVAITDLAPVTVVASGTNVGGNFTITNTTANAIIRDGGSASNIIVKGNLVLLAPTAGTGFVQFTGSSSTFGGVEAQAGSGASTILDNSSLVLQGGTHLVGNASFTSSGDITTSGIPAGLFGGSLTLVAGGKIVITNPFTVTAGLTVDATAGPTDLSILSLATNLGGIAVINFGNTSNYFAPHP